VGEGEYDVCDQEPDNTALVFGERLRQMVRSAEWDEWVLTFANVCAHEIGHTLGFEHVPRDGSVVADRPLYIELMLDGHTTQELRREQRFLASRTYCP
jgi:hypothetical protein